MLYLIFSQVTMFLMNLAILINSKLNAEFYKIYYMSVPVTLYCIFFGAFYIKRMRNLIHKRHRRSFVEELVPLIAVSVINVVYFVVEVFIDSPDNPFLFYICTTVIQLINVLFIFRYQKKLIEKYMTATQKLFSDVVLYIYVVLAVLTLYTCIFMNIYITIIILLLTSFVIALSLSILYMARKKYMEYLDEDEPKEDDEEFV